MTKNRYQTTKRKKALINQSFNSELEMTAIKSSSKHTVKGMSSSDKDNSKLFDLRQSNACGNNPNAVIGGIVMVTLLDTFMNSSLMTQGSTILFLGLLIYAFKRH
ncbi:hypothetical protein DML75_23855 [Salmonella enterica subsp. enterica serovar Typhimurium]|uniref:Uncharacterized protein n=1 Tax=Salmonella enterica TaxID=28901 RepID=A0A5T8GY83_SALER|nr:hypothetical protein [Salmonella enterica]ECB5119172.1 hypothetical protein [Salmonella enterica subsp. enterica serovar Typhimurium]ECG9979306.1 hypothetical protein [Salmonella enterica subsp. enterica serovar Typhimurium]ECS9432389.1 hypothetical protein [Salmonella enterica subsp. enterica serovar Typhimurium]ECU2627644.1 hypothetical protein [Salmonella enterica subsp. enterica serovar Typhimurium]